MDTWCIYCKNNEIFNYVERKKRLGEGDFSGKFPEKKWGGGTGDSGKETIERGRDWHGGKFEFLFCEKTGNQKKTGRGSKV